MDQLYQGFESSYMMYSPWSNSLSTDPSKGPLLEGWKKYDHNDGSTLAILGISETGALTGNHFEADASCNYWNTILPIYPQVRIIQISFVWNI